MELSKEDIKTIGYHRFNKNHQKHFYGMVSGGLILLIIVMLAIQTFSSGSWQLALAVVIAMAVSFIIGLFLYNRAADKAANSFLEECESNPTLTYVPEPTKETERIIE